MTDPGWPSRWAVSMVVASWPRGGTWTAVLCDHFANGELKGPADGLDLIERWSRAGRAGALPLLPDGRPVTVHGRLGFAAHDDGESFVVVVTWTPWRADDEFATDGHPEARPRGWAEAEVARFLRDPQGFSPAPDEESGVATGLFNKMGLYVGRRTHITDHHGLWE